MLQALRLASDSVGGRLGELPLPRITFKELPTWWRCGKHDRALIAGVLLHGCDAWTAISEDPALPFHNRPPEEDAGERAGQAPDKGERLPLSRACFKVLKSASNALKRHLQRTAERAALRMLTEQQQAQHLATY